VLSVTKTSNYIIQVINKASLSDRSSTGKVHVSEDLARALVIRKKQIGSQRQNLTTKFLMVWAIQMRFVLVIKVTVWKISVSLVRCKSSDCLKE
jgi:hypothetical protein